MCLILVIYVLLIMNICSRIVNLAALLKHCISSDMLTSPQGMSNLARKYTGSTIFDSC